MRGPTPPRDGGFTLLEVLLALLLFIVSFLALALTLSTALSSGGANENLLVATYLAEEKMEEIRNQSYSSILSEAKALVSGLSAFQREVAVTTPSTNLKQVTVTVYWSHEASELSTNFITYASNV